MGFEAVKGWEGTSGFEKRPTKNSQESNQETAEATPRNRPQTADPGWASQKLGRGGGEGTGLPWWSSGEKSRLPTQGTRARSLFRQSPCATRQQSVCVTTTDAGVPSRMRSGARPLQLKAVRSNEDPAQPLVN